MRTKTKLIFISFLFIIPSLIFPQIKNVYIDASKYTEDFNLISGTHGKPYKGNTDFTGFYKELGFSIIRTHDYYGPTDWHNIFPDWDADPYDEKNYKFSSSDSIILALNKSGLEILYRLGTSWRGRNKTNINDPPGTLRNINGKITHYADEKDFRKFAQICQHIVMHYNKGWAKGYYLNIRRWEVWNEPSLRSQFWEGTPEQFRKMFTIVINTLRKFDNSLILGGPGQEGMNSGTEYVDSLLMYCKKEKVKLDFYSFHTYGGRIENLTPYETVNKYNYYRNKLNNYGFKYTKIICTEYNCAPSGRFSNTLKAASFITSFMTYSELNNIPEVYFYRGDDHPMGLIKERNNMLKAESNSFLMCKILTTNTIKLKTEGSDKEGFTAISSKVNNQNRIFILISNFQNSRKDVLVSINDLNSLTEKDIKITEKTISSNGKIEISETKEIKKNK